MIQEVSLSGGKYMARIRHYNHEIAKSQRKSKIAMSVSIIGFMALPLAYSMMTDVTLGLSSYSPDVCMIVAAIGFSLLITGMAVSFAFDFETRRYKQKIANLERRMSKVSSIHYSR